MQQIIMSEKSPGGKATGIKFQSHYQRTDSNIVCTDVSVGQRYGLHEVDPLGVDLDEGEDVPGLHCVTQRVEPRRRIGTLLPGVTFLCVFGCDEVFPRLPGGRCEEAAAQLQLYHAGSLCEWVSL